MANWKKMAEAFGRATFGRNDKENPAIKVARDSYKRDLDNYLKDKDAAERAEAFNRGNEEAWMDERSIVRDKDGRPDIRLESNDVAEARGDARLDDNLQRDFDEAFEEAVARRKEDRLNEWDWDGKPENQVGDDWDYSAAKDRDDAAEQQVRDEMIKELKSGMPLSDFFERYRAGK